LYQNSLSFLKSKIITETRKKRIHFNLFREKRAAQLTIKLRKRHGKMGTSEEGTYFAAVKNVLDTTKDFNWNF
jgi:hypothetical protein